MIDNTTPVGTRVFVDSQGWESRLVRWDSFDRPVIATPCDSNPHCCTWPYLTASLTVAAFAPDWVEHSKFKAGQKVIFDYELEGFEGMRIGFKTPAVLVAPHIRPGDWVVDYERHDNGHTITRMLSESQMNPPPRPRTLDDEWAV